MYCNRKNDDDEIDEDDDDDDGDVSAWVGLLSGRVEGRVRLRNCSFPTDLATWQRHSSSDSIRGCIICTACALLLYYIVQIINVDLPTSRLTTQAAL